MKTARYVTLLVLSVCVTALAAAQPPKQVFEYLKPILEREVGGAGDVWASSGSGGYVFRFDLDVSGDGLPEMFITSSLELRNQSAMWSVYKAQGNGNYVPYTYAPERSGLSAFATEIHIEDVGGTKSILTFGSDRGKNYAGRYSFRDSRVAFEIKEVDAATFDRLKSSPTVKRVVPEVQGVLMVDLLRNPIAAWKRIDFERNAPDPNGYFIAVEDAERVKGFGNFTPDLALRWLASAAAGKAPVDASAVPIPELAPAPVPTATPAPSLPTPTVAANPAPVVEVERKSPVWPWVVGMLALVVIVAVALNRRA